MRCAALAVLLAACSLVGEKNACEVDAHCFSGFVCQNSVCVIPRSPGAQPEPQAAVVAIVTNSSDHALATTDPDAATDDLEPFLKAAAEKQIVGLGDTYFTSGGLNEVKARLVRALVQDAGYRVLALTAPWRESLAAADYVEKCTGTPEQALEHLGDIYQDVTMRNLVTWLCAYNRKHPSDPVRLLGYDIVQPWLDVDAFEAFAEVSPNIDAGVAERLVGCSSARFSTEQEFHSSVELKKILDGETPMQQSSYDRCMSELGTLSTQFDHADDGGAQALYARASVQSFKAWESYVYLESNGQAQKAFEAWEQGNFALLDLLRSRGASGKKTIVFAHAVSIARASEELAPYRDAHSLGSALNRRYGASYMPVAISAYDLSTRLEGMEHPDKPTASYSVERRLQDRAEALETDALYVALDTDEVFTEGQLYELAGDLALDPRRQFEAMFFVSRSPAMTFAR